MQSENWKKIKEVLDEALKVAPADRQNFLNNSALTPEIRAEVESLISFEKDAQMLMNAPAVEFSKEFFSDEEDAAAGRLIGQEIGNYRITGELGYGGMGAVYMAERADGKFEQKVALKLLKREMNTSALRRRFEQERKILATLEHPNIARLLDAGTTGDGVPYFAMEYIDGVPIDEYCYAHRLSLNERLDLFRETCAAIAFAHRNLIVHRDIKPSNILVNRDGMPKLLDFGISKILSDEFDQTATVTGLGAMTPSYASPEQLKNKSVSTSTDIYSLGVVLYELLSGHRPFESKESDLGAIHRAVIETDPPLPSAVKTTGARTDEFRSAVFEDEGKNNTVNNRSQNTNAGATQIPASALKGDLDNIILKALKKEPERRYLSVENFAEDIRRHQEGLTVSARPDVFSHRAAKFIRRNRLAAGAAMLIFLAIVAGLGATLWQARVAASERDRAQRQAQKAERINAYMQNILNFSNPHWLSSNPARTKNATVAQAMDEALKNIDKNLGNEADVQAEVLFTLATSYAYQGQQAKAEELLRRSIDLFRQSPEKNELKPMQAAVILGDILFLSGKYDEARQNYEAAIAYFRPKLSEDKAHYKWLTIALNDLANVYHRDGKFDEGDALISEANELAENLEGADRYVIPILRISYCSRFYNKGKFEESAQCFLKAEEVLKEQGRDKSFEGGTLASYQCMAYINAKQFDRAEPKCRDGYEITRDTSSEDGPYTLWSLYNLAGYYFNTEKYPEAKQHVDKILAIARAQHPNGNVSLGNPMRLLGDIQTKTGQLKEGEASLRLALQYMFTALKEPSPEIAGAKASLGDNLIAQKRFSEARELLTSAVDNFSKTRGDEHPFTKKNRDLLASLSQ